MSGSPFPEVQCCALQCVELLITKFKCADSYDNCPHEKGNLEEGALLSQASHFPFPFPPHPSRPSAQGLFAQAAACSFPPISGAALEVSNLPVLTQCLCYLTRLCQLAKVAIRC